MYYGTPDPTNLDALKQLEELGITHCAVAPWATQDDPYPSVEKYLEGFKRFGDEVIAKLA